MEGFLTVIIALLVCLCLVNTLLFVRFKGATRQFDIFFRPAGEGQPSPAARIAESVAALFAAELVKALKGNLQGDRITQAHMAKTVEKAIAADVLQSQSPGLAAILSQMPTLQRKLTANPALMQYAIQFLNRFAAGGSGKVEGNKPGVSLPLNIEL